MRLFTAVDIPPAVRERLTVLLHQLRPLARLKWSSPEKFHITTKFIGEWPEDRLAELTAALAAIRSSGPIEISIRGIDWFANGRVLCTGISASPGLAELAHATESVLATLGVPVEDRVFSPHLTLARNRERVRTSVLDAAIKKLPSSDFGTFQVSAFALYLSRDGKYTQLKEFSFL